MRVVLLALLAASAFAQTLTLTPSATVVYPGEPLAISVALSGGSTPSGLQWSAPLPGLVTTAGAASTAASKGVQCATVAGATNCIVYGINQAKIADGIIASIAVPTATPGTISFGLTGLMGSTDTGQAVALTSAPVAVTVTTKCDVDKSGKTDPQDVGAYLPQALGSAPCTQSLTGDSKCDIRSLIVLIYAAMPGGTCSAK